METHSASAPSSASWTDDDITALVDYLYRSRAAIEEFKPKLFRKAAIHLEAMRTEGGAKDATNTRNKWNNIKAQWAAVNRFRKSSGVGWDATKGGAFLSTPAEFAVFEQYMTAHPKDKPHLSVIRNKSWPLLSKLDDLIAPSTATGRFAFSPLSMTPSSANDFSSESEPASDEDEDYFSSLGFDPRSESSLASLLSTLSATIANMAPFLGTSTPTMATVQGALDHLVDATVKSVEATTQGAIQAAVAKIDGAQRTEDSLTPAERLYLIRLVTDQPNKASAYIAQQDSVLRRAWIRLELLPFRNEIEMLQAEL